LKKVSKAAGSNIDDKLLNNALLAGFLAFLIFFSISKINGDDDFFWHLSTGKYIVENHTVPSADVFGFVTEGMKWIPFEWLWDVTAYTLFNIGGFTAMYVLNSIVLILIFYFFLSIFKKYGIPIHYTAFYFLIAALTLRYRFELKPNMFSYLFLVLLFKLILDYKYFNSGIKKLFYIPVIFLFWANMHMGVFSGYLLFFLFVIYEFYELIISSKKKEDEETRKNRKKNFLILSAVFVVSVAAALINPNGINTYIYSYNHTKMKMLEGIFEWLSPFHENFLGKLYNLLYIFYLILIIPVFYYSRKKKDYFPLLVYIVFAYYSTRAVRFTMDFLLIAVVFAFIVVYDLYLNKPVSIKKQKAPENKIFKYITFSIIILFIILTPSGLLYKYLGFAKEHGSGIYEGTFPVKVFSFMKENKVAESGSKPFNVFDNGGYFLWNFPGKKNFIDSRNLNDSIWNSFLTVINKKEGYKKIIQEYDFDYFILFFPALYMNTGLLESTVTSYLSQIPNDWKLIYWDDQTLLFVKNNDAFKNIIEKYEYKYLTPYNIFYKKDNITNAISSDFEKIDGEVKRKQAEEPQGELFKKFFVTFGKKTK
jgi:hypothetical protein